MEQNIQVNLTEEIERAKQTNFNRLMNELKEQVLQEHSKDLDLFTFIVNNSVNHTLDKLAFEKFNKLKEQGLIDEMNMPVQ